MNATADLKHLPPGTTAATTRAELKQRLVVFARTLGFDSCRIAACSTPAHADEFDDWLDEGAQGEMDYMARATEKRRDPQKILDGTKSIIVLALNYFQGDSAPEWPLTAAETAATTEGRARGRIARYAWGDDYHDVIGGRLETLLDWMRRSSPEPFDARGYVDTGPVQERVYAQYAGIGWIGKHTCVINDRLGSWIFLAEIITSLPLAVDAPATDQCGTCTLCLEACPTGAIVEAGVLDSTRCISYLTIEHRGEIPAALQPALGAHVYGCDVCQEVCPWNQAAPTSADPAWQPRPAWDAKTIAELRQMPDDVWQTALRGSAMKRTKLVGLRRNLAIADAAPGRSRA